MFSFYRVVLLLSSLLAFSSYGMFPGPGSMFTAMDDTLKMQLHPVMRQSITISSRPIVSVVQQQLMNHKSTVDSSSIVWVKQNIEQLKGILSTLGIKLNFAITQLNELNSNIEKILQPYKAIISDKKILIQHVPAELREAYHKKFHEIERLTQRIQFTEQQIGYNKFAVDRFNEEIVQFQKKYTESLESKSLQQLKSERNVVNLELQHCKNKLDTYRKTLNPENYKKVYPKIIKYEGRQQFIEAKLKSLQEHINRNNQIYLQHVQKIQKNLSQLHNWSLLDDQGKKLLNDVNLTIFDQNDLRYSFSFRVDQKMETFLKQFDVSTNVFEPKMANALQKSLYKSINSDLKYLLTLSETYKGNNEVMQFVDSAMKSMHEAVRVIEYGSPQEAIDAAFLTKMVSKGPEEYIYVHTLSKAAKEFGVGLVKGQVSGMLATGHLGYKFASAVVHPIETAHAAIHFGQKLADYTHHSERMQKIVGSFAQLSLEQKAEAIGSLLGAWYSQPIGSVYVNSVIADSGLTKIVKNIQERVKVEAVALQNLIKTESTGRVLINNVAVPERYVKTIQQLIKDGKIASPQDIKNFIERAEAPILTKFSDAILATQGKKTAEVFSKAQSAAEADIKISKATEIASKTATESHQVSTAYIALVQKLEKGLAEVISVKELVAAVENLDHSVGNLEKLKSAISMFKDVKGALGSDGAISKLFANGHRVSVKKLGTARGAAFELEKAHDLAQQGKKVIGFGQKLQWSTVSKEFDIICEGALIECKNIDWNKANIQYMKDGTGARIKIAKSMNKIFEFHSKSTIPEYFKSWLLEKGAFVVEG